MDGRLIVLLLWGGGTLAVYGRVLWMRRQAHEQHHDRRSRRDYLTAFGFFLVALGSAGSIGFVLFGDVASGPRSFSLALALGSFLGVGIFMATEKPEKHE